MKMDFRISSQKIIFNIKISLKTVKGANNLSVLTVEKNIQPVEYLNSKKDEFSNERIVRK